MLRCYFTPKKHVASTVLKHTDSLSVVNSFLLEDVKLLANNGKVTTKYDTAIKIDRTRKIPKNAIIVVVCNDPSDLDELIERLSAEKDTEKSPGKVSGNGK